MLTKIQKRLLTTTVAKVASFKKDLHNFRMQQYRRQQKRQWGQLQIFVDLQCLHRLHRLYTIELWMGSAPPVLPTVFRRYLIKIPTMILVAVAVAVPMFVSERYIHGCLYVHWRCQRHRKWWGRAVLPIAIFLAAMHPITQLRSFQQASLERLSGD